MSDQLGGNGSGAWIIGGPPRFTYVEVRKRSPGNSEYRLVAADPSVVTWRSHLPAEDR